MNPIELDRAWRELRMGGMAPVLKTRLQQTRAELMAPIHSDSTHVGARPGL